METLQPAIIDRGDTGPLKKPPELYNIGNQSDESNYVDLDDLLDVKSDGTKTVKVTFTGDGNQLAIFKCNSDTSSPGDRSPGDREAHDNTVKISSKDRNEEHSKDVGVEKRYSEDLSADHAPLSQVPNDSEVSSTADTEENPETDPTTEITVIDGNPPQTGTCEPEELQYTDMYLNSSRSESEDGTTSVVLSDQSALSTFLDESHYITTHEIQLTELDHDVDYEFGPGSCWDFEDDNLVYSFVDYASFESEDTTEGTLILDGRSQAKSKSNKAQSINIARRPASGTVVSTEQESDLCDSDKCVDSDESVFKNHNGTGNSAGQIHLSIKTSSRAINDSNNIPENENICYHARHLGERSHYFFKSTDTKGQALYDRARYFIPAPGRQHLASKLKGKDINEYSSGASSSVSELDDADKEVRNLTAKSFRSLACPYFDAINLSTSSESSVSEHGLGINKWSAFVDLNYGNLAQGREQNLIAHKSSTSTFEVNKSADCKSINGMAIANLTTPQTKIFSLNNKAARSKSHKAESSACKKIRVRGQFDTGHSEMVTLTETLNFSCNVDAAAPEGKRRAKCVENAAGSRSADEVTDILPVKSGSEAATQHSDTGDAMEDTHKKAIFASSLLKNVISKKMQFEQERKMERGELRDPRVFNRKEQDVLPKVTAKGLQRQTSDTGSGLTIISLDELEEAIDTISRDSKEEAREHSLTPALDPSTESPDEARVNSKDEPCESKRGPLPRSQTSAFKSWKDGEPDIKTESKSDGKNESSMEKSPLTTERAVEDKASESASNKLIKMSHLYVPSSQLLPKDKASEQPSHSKTAPRAPAETGELEDRKVNVGHSSSRAEVTTQSAHGTKAPEIKIRLRSVKENKSNPFNIANLLTPNLSYNVVNPVKTAWCDSKTQVLSTSDKVPHFMVRNFRDYKCKFQTPIHQVRDVRKLVKSSYRFVSLENSEGKATAGASASVLRETTKKEPDKKPSPSAMVIKCQSVNTNNTQRGYIDEVTKGKQAEGASESDRFSPKQSSECAKNEAMLAHRAASRTPCARQLCNDQSEFQLKIETKTAKRRQEKTVDSGERKPESKLANQAALDKLKAAVKTMEQLYVFDRNEWKRKTQAPRPITGSHVLSLITSEEHVVPCRADFEGELVEHEKLTSTSLSAEKSSSTLPSASGMTRLNEERGYLKTAPLGHEEAHVAKILSHPSEAFNHKCVLKLGNTLNAPASPGPARSDVQQGVTAITKTFTSKSPKTPSSLRMSQLKGGVEERGRVSQLKGGVEERGRVSQLKGGVEERGRVFQLKGGVEERGRVSQLKGGVEERGRVSQLKGGVEERGRVSQLKGGVEERARLRSRLAESPFPPLTADSENYLTIPVRARAAVEAKPSGRDHHAVSPASEPERSSQQSSPVVTETWSPESPTAATIYHHSLPVAMHGVQPQVICEHVPGRMLLETQRRVLLDPTTGQCYLVDTPVQPAVRRLYDPETGQYVDVPMPPPPLTPVPMPLAPLAISPAAAFSPTYMIYPPGLLPSPTAPPARAHSHASSHSEGDDVIGGGYGAEWREGGGGAGSPYLCPPGRAPHLAAGKPIISITTQQGPRIIAPPSFDGTTMSFVVEHR